MSSTERVFVDALIFSAFPSEMEYYHLNIPGLRKVTHGPMEYSFGTLGSKSIALTHVGLGKLQATSSLHFAFAHFQPLIILFTGTAGAVDMSLRTGNVVIGARSLDADLFGIHQALTGTPFEEALVHRHREGLIPEEYSADPRLVELAVREPSDWKKLGILATSDNFPSPKEKIESLRKFGVSSMDMETSAFYHVASLFKVPVLAIRSISNELDHTGMDEKIASSDIKSGHRAAELALFVAKNY